MSDRPVFVIGCPRSGTTMLQLMLHSHPRLAVPPIGVTHRRYSARPFGLLPRSKRDPGFASKYAARRVRVRVYRKLQIRRTNVSSSIPWSPHSGSEYGFDRWRAYNCSFARYEATPRIDA